MTLGGIWLFRFWLNKRAQIDTCWQFYMAILRHLFLRIRDWAAEPPRPRTRDRSLPPARTPSRQRSVSMQRTRAITPQPAYFIQTPHAPTPNAPPMSPIDEHEVYSDQEDEPIPIPAAHNTPASDHTESNTSSDDSDWGASLVSSDLSYQPSRNLTAVSASFEPRVTRRRGQI
jgi:hypothetical protein